MENTILNINESIYNLVNSDAKYDDNLMMSLYNIKDKLNETSEYLVLNEYVDVLKKYTHFNIINEELNRINRLVTQNEYDLRLNTIYETMKVDYQSAFLVPVIGNLFEAYMKNQNENSKALLLQNLYNFSYDPYIREMISELNKTIKGEPHYNLNESVDVRDVYSPIYPTKNGYIFKVGDNFYKKIKNNISKISKPINESADSDYIELSKLSSNPAVSFDDRGVTVYSNTDADIALIPYNKTHNVKINEESVNLYKLNVLKESAQLLNNGKYNFYYIVENLRKNVDKIKKIDFAKRIVLKENENVYADIFNLDNVLSVNVNTDKTHKNEKFSKNCNPFQLINIIKESLNYDISNEFNDIIPTYKGILNEMESTKKLYIDTIKVYETKLKDLYSKVDESDKYLELVDVLNEELNTLKEEFKEYCHKCDKFIGNMNEDFTVTITDDNKNTHTIIIPETPKDDSNNKDKGDEDNDTEDKESSDDENQDETSDKDTNNNDEEDYTPNEEDDIDFEADEMIDFGEGDDEVTETYINKRFNSKYNKKKLNEGKSKVKLFLIKKSKKNESSSLNESNKDDVQIMDTVEVKGDKGTVVGVLNKDLVVSVNGNTVIIDPSKAKKLNKTNKDNTRLFKFDKQTMKLLENQYVRCGIYQNNIPIMLNGCSVNYSDWVNAKDDENINVIIEGKNNVLTKGLVRILEDVNTFANVEDYVEGVIVDEEGKAVENVLLNSIDYSNALGGSSEVRVIKKGENGENVLVTLPQIMLKTLAV